MPKDLTHTEAKLRTCSDRMLQSMLNGLRAQRRYPAERELILMEMGRRCAQAARVQAIADALADEGAARNASEMKLRSDIDRLR